jgi:hypothetical protein
MVEERRMTILIAAIIVSASLIGAAFMVCLSLEELRQTLGLWRDR